MDSQQPAYNTDVNPMVTDSADSAGHNPVHIRANASEIGYLWSSYQAETMSVCFLKYIVEHAKDPDYKPIFQRALEVSNQRVSDIEQIFNEIKHPVPEAFGERDVDIKADELFSESYLLAYTRMTNKFILINYTQAFTVASRSDICNFLIQCQLTAREVYDRATAVLKAKGLLMKTPYIPVPDRAEHTHDQKYFGSLWRKSRRPLHALEVSHLFENIESKLILETLNLGFSQVVREQKLKEYLIRGKAITDKHVKTLAETLEREDLPVPTTSDFEITTSQQSPFSDRLVMFHVTVVTAFSISGYGHALTNCADRSGRRLYPLDHGIASLCQRRYGTHDCIRLARADAAGRRPQRVNTVMLGWARRL